jgi:outer membrane protein assembly factor BamB
LSIWQDRYLSPSGKKREYAESEGEGPYATPAIDGDRLYTLGINAVLSCYDAASGELKWRRDYARDLASKTRFCGTAASPLIEGGLVIFYVGDDDKGRLIALDKKTGRDRWQWVDAGAAYASPIVAEIEGVRQLIVLTDQSAAGIAPASGAMLWSLPVPSSRGGCSRNIPTPVAPGGNIILLSHAKGTEALKLARAGQQWEIEQVWKNPRLTMNLSLPVTDGRHLFGLSTQRKGQYFCLDARSGEIAWTSEGREGDIASTLLAGNHLLFLSDAGVLSIATKRADKFETVAKYTVAESKVWAHPIANGKTILVRTDSTLTLWGFE